MRYLLTQQEYNELSARASKWTGTSTLVATRDNDGLRLYEYICPMHSITLERNKDGDVLVYFSPSADPIIISPGEIISVKIT